MKRKTLFASIVLGLVVVFGCEPINPCHTDADCAGYQTCAVNTGYCEPKQCDSDADCPGTTCGTNGICNTPQPPDSTSSGGCEGPNLEVDVHGNSASFNKSGDSPGEVFCQVEMVGTAPYYGLTFETISTGSQPIQLIPGSCSATTNNGGVSCTTKSINGGWQIDCPIFEDDGLSIHNHALICDVSGITSASAADTGVTAVEVGSGACPVTLDPDGDKYHVEGIGL